MMNKIEKIFQKKHWDFYDGENFTVIIDENDQPYLINSYLKDRLYNFLLNIDKIPDLKESIVLAKEKGGINDLEIRS